MIIGTLNKAVHTALAEPEVHGGFLKHKAFTLRR